MRYGISYSLVSLGIVIAYSAYTISMTSWSTKISKVMNSAKNAAANLAYDSQRYDSSLSQ